MTMQEKISPDTKGLIYNIQRYNLHDGPGIRTILFLKGCPLRCLWCANPESQNPFPEQMGDSTVGYELTAREAVDQAARDMAFFKRSGGGLTISGGEATAQPDFTQAVAEEAKARGLHVTIETACAADWNTFQRVTFHADLILADIKLMDGKRHRQAVGSSNRVILENIRCLAAAGKPVIVRVPVIPGYNSDEKNLRETAIFCKESGIREIHWLPYHELGVNKYQKLNRQYQLSHIRPPAKQVLIALAGKLEQELGIEIRVL